MTFYVKRDVLTKEVAYEVCDRNDSTVYTAKSDFFYHDARLILSNLSGRELVRIDQQRLQEKPVFEISINGSIHATLQREKPGETPPSM